MIKKIILKKKLKVMKNSKIIIKWTGKIHFIFFKIKFSLSFKLFFKLKII
jgi:hypothetical protein